jgi:hypothetical protein
VRIARNQHHANLVVRHRRDVKLAAVAPMDLHELGPRRHAVMAAEAIAQALPPARIQAGPAPHARMAAIRAHNPARRPRSRRWRELARHPSPSPPCPTPAARPPAAAWSINSLVQRGPADSQPWSAREPRFHPCRTLRKSECPENAAAGALSRSMPQRPRGSQSVRHDAFAARLVDGWPLGIRHCDIQAASPRGNGGSQARRAAADDK